MCACSYPISEAKRIDALIENRGTAAACEFQERLIPTLKDNPYPNDHQSLRLVTVCIGFWFIGFCSSLLIQNL